MFAESTWRQERRSRLVHILLSWLVVQACTNLQNRPYPWRWSNIFPRREAKHTDIQSRSAGSGAEAEAACPDPQSRIESVRPAYRQTLSVSNVFSSDTSTSFFSPFLYCIF